MKIIHLTDPHLVPRGQMLWGLDPTARLDACLADAARLHADAAFCVLSGDLTDAGDRDAYVWLKQRLAEIRMPSVLMLGNHDDRKEFRSVFPEHPCDASGFIQQARHTPDGVFLFLDTLKGGTAPEGQYCTDRQAWLVREIERAGDHPIYIFMHHPPCNIGIEGMDRIKLEEADAFRDIISAGANIRHIFFGHVHRVVYVNWHGIPCSSLPGTNHQVSLVADQLGSAYTNEPPGYGIIQIEAGGVAVHFDACLNRDVIPKTQF